MPRVPTYDAFQATPNTLPQVQFRPGVVDPARFNDQSGQQLQQVGDAIGRLGAVQDQQTIDMQQQANQLRVDDALNKAKEAALRLTYDKDVGYTNQKGIAALERQSGKPLADEYGDELQKHVATIGEGLGNESQRMAFSMRANDLLTNFRGQAIQHESNEFKTYALSVREGTISTRMQEIGLNYNNPAVIDEAVTSIKAAVYDQARLLGKSAEWSEAQARTMTSNAHKVALSAALEQNDVAYAEAYLKKYSKQMDADDLLRVRGVITKEKDAQVALATATDVMRTAVPRMVTADFDRMLNITVASESGGRRYGSDGKLLESPKGAKGEMQVMDGTNLNPGYGVKPAKDDSPEERARVGRDYLGAMVKEFDGNIAQAWAAYNAGPGATQKAIKQAEKEGGEWLAYLPKETQQYVAKNMAAYGTGDGQYTRPSLQDVHNAVRERIGTTSPNRLKLALDEATRQYEDASKAIKQREEESTAAAMRAVLQNGGRFSALPAAIRASLPPKEVDNVMNFAARVAKGDDVTNPAIYQKLAGDTNYLKSLSDSQFFMLRRELSESDFKQFAKERGELISGKSGNTAEDLNTPAINAVLNDRLRTLDIDPTPKDGSDEAMRVGAMRKAVRESILNAQVASGKKLSDADVEKHIDGMFAKSQEFRTTFLGFNTGSTSQRLLEMKASDIPSNIKDKLRADFKAAGVSKPTDGDLLGAYWQLKFAKR